MMPDFLMSDFFYFSIRCSVFNTHYFSKALNSTGY